MLGLVRGRLCVGTFVRDGATQLFELFPPAVILTRWGWPSSCSTRVTTLNLAYVTRGLGLGFLRGCFFALLFPFSGIGIDGDGICLWTRIAFFVADFVVFS